MRPGVTSAEAARLATLARYDILDTEPEQAFDDIARIAAIVCDARYAQINFIDADRQWSKASVGLPREALPRAKSVCAVALNRPELLAVEDLAADDRLRDLIRVGDGGILRFYAGVPIIAPDGHAMGTLCVLDSRPRRLTPAQREALTALGRQVESQLQLRHSPARGEREESFRRLSSAASEGL